MCLWSRSLKLHTRLSDFDKKRSSRSEVEAFETEFRFFSWTAIHLNERDLCQYYDHRAERLSLIQLSSLQQKSIEFQARLASHSVAQRSNHHVYDSWLSSSVASHVLLFQHQSSIALTSRCYISKQLDDVLLSWQKTLDFIWWSQFNTILFGNNLQFTQFNMSHSIRTSQSFRVLTRLFFATI